METQTSNEILKIEYDKEKNCLYHSWKKKTENADWKDIQAGVQLYVDYIDHFRPKGVLVDERENEPYLFCR